MKESKVKTTYRYIVVLLSIRRNLIFRQLAGQYTEILAPRFFRGQVKPTKSLDIQIITIQTQKLFYNYLLTVTKSTCINEFTQFKDRRRKTE